MGDDGRTDKYRQLDEPRLMAVSRHAYVERRRRFWLLDARRREAILGSDAAFLVSFLIAWVLSDVIAYVYALWSIGPVR